MRGAPRRARDVDLALSVLGASEVDEHLLEWRLTDGIVVDVVVLLGPFHRAEHPRPRQLIARYLQAKRLYSFIHLIITNTFIRPSMDNQQTDRQTDIYR